MTSAEETRTLTGRKARLKQQKTRQAGDLTPAAAVRDSEVKDLVRRCRRSAREIAGPGATEKDQIRAFHTCLNLALRLRAEQAGNDAAASAAARRLREGLPEAGLQNPEWILNAHHTAMRDVFTIIGGDAVTGFPECVLVGKSTQFCCSGVLIHPRAVLTAAHCTGGHGCAATRIGIGHDQENLDRPTVDVANFRIAPGYDSISLQHDVAVLILAEEVTDITLPVFATSAEINAARAITAVGFGNTNAAGTEGFGIKHQAVIAVQSRTVSELVAISLNIADTCTGDSGCPIYVPAPGGALALAGITSRAVPSDQHPAVCGVGGIYSRIDAYTNFIDSVLQTL